MANYYQEFSEEITWLTEEEVEWIRSILLYDHDGDMENLDEEEFQTYCDKHWDGDEENIPDECWPSIEYEIEHSPQSGTSIWMHGGQLEYVAVFVKKFLARFRPTNIFSLTWADTCSKPRIGAFGGGLVVISATQTEWRNTASMVDEIKSQVLEGGGKCD